MRIYLLIFLLTWTSWFTTPVTSGTRGHQVRAMVGDDVILQCHIEPPVNMENETVEWTRGYMTSPYVHRLLDGRVDSEHQNPSYKQRTSLFPEQLSHGNISLKLTRVKLSDQGTYICSVPHLNGYSEIQLLLGSVSQPVISLTGTKGDLSSWRCDSGCWFPEPEMSWLDRDGNNITAEPSVTEKPSDDCYVVQRNVTVALTERVTCRVHLPHINHTVETHSVKAESLTTGVMAGIVLTVIIVVTAILGYFYWKKQKQTMSDGSNEMNMSQEEPGEQEQLNDDSISSPSLVTVTKVTSPKPTVRWSCPNTDDSDVTKVTSPKPTFRCSPQLEKPPNADDSDVTKVASPKPQEWSSVSKRWRPEKLPNNDDSEVTKVTSPKLREWNPVSKRWRPQLQKLANADDCNVTKVRSLVFVEKYEFRIAKGSDGNEVFLGLREDGTEVAVKRMTKSNHHVLKKEKNLLGLPDLDDPSIVRYVDFIEDKNFVYLVLQLCEYNLEEYITKHNISEPERKRLANQVLKSLSILHCHNLTIVHRDIKPQNVLIDIQGRARLADFGISRLLPEEQTTLFTGAAGTKCWRAKETLDVSPKSIPYKRSSDMQVAGMLIYYILSGGEHPFGEGARCETNILDGKYNLHHVQDVVAKDLIEWMINENPNRRPTAGECLIHPFFWSNERRAEYLRRIGNLKEIENCQNADEDLIKRLDQHAEQRQFNTWKHKFSQELVQKMDDKKKSYPDHSFGLLRFIHDLHELYAEDAAGIDLMEMFPDLFGGVYKFAKEQDWNSRPSLKEFTADAVNSPNPERKTRLSLPVQESGTH